MSRELSPKEYTKRADLLYTALELLYDEPSKQMVHKDFMELLKTAPNSTPVCAALVKQEIITVTNNGRKPATVSYTGIAPNPVVCKKIIESVIKAARQCNVKHRAKLLNNKVSSAAELTAVQVKPGPLQYPQFMKELAILKERYKQTIPNAEIEVTVKVSSLATV